MQHSKSFAVKPKDQRTKTQRVARSKQLTRSMVRATSQKNVGLSGMRTNAKKNLPEGF